MAKERYTYKIDENNAVSIFDADYPNEDSSPNLFQPGHPTSAHTPWENKEEAEAWAKETIANLINPPAPIVIPEVVYEPPTHPIPAEIIDAAK